MNWSYKLIWDEKALVNLADNCIYFVSFAEAIYSISYYMKLDLVSLYFQTFMIRFYEFINGYEMMHKA